MKYWKKTLRIGGLLFLYWNLDIKSYGVRLVIQQGEGLDGLYFHLGKRVFAITNMGKRWWRKNRHEFKFVDRGEERYEKTAV